LSAIKASADQYVVAFLNGRPALQGSVYWGIRNEDRVIVGVALSEKECDELRRVVTEKLHQITPPLAPTDYQIHRHQLSDGSRNIAGLYVVEIRIPAVERKLLFSTSSQDVFIKTDAGRKKLTALEIQHEILRRFNIEPPS
jgi:hypothetical protein